MIIIDLNNFSLDAKNELVNENGELQFWSQPDFAYKKRVHVYDATNDEIGYVQYKILSIQKDVDVFDKKDKPININQYSLEKIAPYEYNISKDNKQIMTSKKQNDKVIIDIKEDINMCILLFYKLLERE